MLRRWDNSVIEELIHWQNCLKAATESVFQKLQPLKGCCLENWCVYIWLSCAILVFISSSHYFYFHFSWHFYFQKYLFRFGKDQSWEGQKLSVWQLEILATEYTILLYLLLKLKPMLNVFSCGSAVWKSFELSVVTWLRIFYLHRSFMRMEHENINRCLVAIKRT